MVQLVDVPEQESILDQSEEDTEETVKIRVEKDDSKDSVVGRYVIFIFGFFIILGLVVFVIWHISRRKHMIRVRNRILELRRSCRPENIIKTEIKDRLRQVRYMPEKGKETDNCAICVDDFKKGQKLLSTECGHLFHEKCIW